MIGPNILKEAKEAIGNLLDRYISEIDQAYLTSEAGIKINIPIKISPSDRRGFEALEVGISFVQKKVKTRINKYVSVGQDPLFKAVEKLRPKKGDGIDSITITNSQTGESATLKAKENKNDLPKVRKEHAV